MILHSTDCGCITALPLRPLRERIDLAALRNAIIKAISPRPKSGTPRTAITSHRMHAQYQVTRNPTTTCAYASRFNNILNIYWIMAACSYQQVRHLEAMQTFHYFVWLFLVVLLATQRDVCLFVFCYLLVALHILCVAHAPLMV